MALVAIIAERSMPEPNSGCWLWLGTIDAYGYGVFRMMGSQIKAHRASYQAFRGDIPAGMLVCHRCDVRSCVNPDHLWIGTNQDNLRDCFAKGRGSFRGEKNPNAVLCPAAVAAIRTSSESAAVLARALGVSAGAVLSVRSRRTWGHVADFIPTDIFGPPPSKRAAA
jgi:hypothetical protein